MIEHISDLSILEVKNLRKQFEGLVALDKCSLTVKKGSITGLIGPNGAGKTTLFNVITGFLKPEGGMVFFKGERIDGLPPHKIFQRRICRTFQITREFKKMTILENLMIIPESQFGEKIFNIMFRPSKIKDQDNVIKERAIEILKFVELVDLKDKLAGSLSGGQKKLLELAKTIMANPDLILLDEPGAGVNRTLLKKLVLNIRTLCKEKGITFLVIEHDMDLVMRLCNPVIVMSHGKKLAEGLWEQIKSDKLVVEAYLGGQYQ